MPHTYGIELSDYYAIVLIFVYADQNRVLIEYRTGQLLEAFTYRTVRYRIYKKFLFVAVIHVLK
jgi:hypothetical protein